MDQYRRESLFSDNLDEFDSAREIVQNLLDEYQLMEDPDYPILSDGRRSNISVQ